MEQQIGTGGAKLGQSIAEGLGNAAGGAIYGNKALKNAGDALLRGAGAGAATAAINNLFHAWDTGNQTQTGNVRTGIQNIPAGVSPYAKNHTSGCGAQSPFSGGISSGKGYGYQYEVPETKKTQQGGFNLVDFAKDVAIGAAMGGLASLTFYKMTKPVDVVKNSARNPNTVETVGNKGGSQKHYIEVNVLLLHQMMYLLMVFQPKVHIMMLSYIPKAILQPVTLFLPPVISLLQQDLPVKMVTYIKLKLITM